MKQVETFEELKDLGVNLKNRDYLFGDPYNH
jgi:hypothetical protein